MIKLSDEDWEHIKHHFPEENIPPGRAGRKPVATRKVLEAVLWILNTGAQWHMLPQCYPNYKTVHRRFQKWCEDNVIRDIMVDIANTLGARDVLDERNVLLTVCSHQEGQELRWYKCMQCSEYELLHWNGSDYVLF